MSALPVYRRLTTQELSNAHSLHPSGIAVFLNGSEEEIATVGNWLATVDALEGALKRAADMLAAVAGDIEDGYSLDSLRDKYLSAIVNARDDARTVLKGQS